MTKNQEAVNAMASKLTGNRPELAMVDRVTTVFIDKFTDATVIDDGGQVVAPTAKLPGFRQYPISISFDLPKGWAVVKLMQRIAAGRRVVVVHTNPA